MSLSMGAEYCSCIPPQDSNGNIVYAGGADGTTTTRGPSTFAQWFGGGGTASNGRPRDGEFELELSLTNGNTLYTTPPALASGTSRSIAIRL